jgi:hypothetical protein
LATAPEPERELVFTAVWLNINDQNAHILAQLVLDEHAIAKRDLPASPVLTRFVQGVTTRLVFDSGSVTDEDLTDIEVLMAVARSRIDSDSFFAIRGNRHQLDFDLERLRKTVALAKYDRLKRLLFSGENPEINSDREALVSQCRQLGFPGDIDRALSFIDVEFAAATNAFNFKTVMDAVRAVLEDVVENAARTDAAATNTAVRLGDTPARFNDGQKALVTTQDYHD